MAHATIGSLLKQHAPPPCHVPGLPRRLLCEAPVQRQRGARRQPGRRCRSLEQNYFTLGGLAEDSDASTVADCDTIAAIVTGAQQGAVSIIRLSGSDAVPIAQQLFQPSKPQHSRQPSQALASAPAWEPESHRIYYGSAVDAQGAVLDEVLLLAMLEPRSYTAEDVIEIHTHGGGISSQRVLQRCLEAGARLAQPGEFTLRAFLNGRLDLSQAESVAELIDARTVAAADSALAGLSGGLGREVQKMRRECVDLLVEMDVRLDFDEDLPPLDVPALVQRIQQLGQQLEATLLTARQGQLLRKGLQVALVGRPNVGKSSLLNALSGTERAIVTAIAGTTRDIVEAGIVIGGVPITLLDTAGLRESVDLVEQIGVERSMAAARQADIVVMVVDAEAGWTAGDQEIAEQLFSSGNSDIAYGFNGSSSSGSGADSSDEGGSSGHAASGHSSGSQGGSGGSRQRPPALLVLNKTDLAMRQKQKLNGSGAAAATGSAAALATVPAAVSSQFAAVVETSAATLAGLDELQQAVLRLSGAPELAPGGISWAVNERQAEALIRAHESLGRVQSSVADDLPVDFWTIDLRAAVLALGEVSGDDVTEEVLDNIFSRFCIGK